MTVLVPVVDARVGPDHPVMLRINPRVIVIMWIPPDFDATLASLDHPYQALDYVSGLAFNMKNQAAAMTEIGVGAVEKEQIGKIGCAHAQISTSIVSPGVR